MVETIFNEKKARFLSLYRPAQNFGNNIIISWLKQFSMKKRQDSYLYIAQNNICLNHDIMILFPKFGAGLYRESEIKEIFQ